MRPENSRIETRRRQGFLRELSEEHFEELAILWRLRSQRVNSPECRLVDLIRLDERLDAHADAVAGLGTSALPLVVDGITSQDAAEVFASVYVVLRGGLTELIQPARDVLVQIEQDGGPLEGFRDALVHAPGSMWSEILLAAPIRSQCVSAMVAEVFASRQMRHEPRPPLSELLKAEEHIVRVCGWRAAAHGLLVPDEAWILGFNDFESDVRCLSLQAAAWQGRTSLLRHLRDVARETPVDQTSLRVWAWVAEDDDCVLVLEEARRLTDLRRRAAVLAALGHPRGIPVLIEMLTDHNPRIAVAAAAAIARMTGWDLDSSRSVDIPPEDAPAGDELAEAFDEVFTLPDADRAQRLWNDHRKLLSAGTRWSNGIDCGRTLRAQELHQIDLESLRAVCLRARLRGAPSWSAARLEAFPQPPC